jgi:hypothetical protein
VMTGWRVLLEYQAAGFSSRMRRVFIEQRLWFSNQGFSTDFVPRGKSCACSAKEKFPNSLKKQ